MQELLRLPMNHPYAGRVEFLQINPFHASLSSTEVRRRIATGEAIEELVPPEVEGYILEHGLYR